MSVDRHVGVLYEIRSGSALSNFVANAPDVIGFDPFERLVELIAARAGLLQPLR